MTRSPSDLVASDVDRSDSLDRHPGDVLRVALGGGAVALTGLVAAGARLGTLETDVFRVVNRLPAGLEPPLWAVMQLGSLAAVPVTVVAALLARRRRLAADLAVAGGAAYLGARVLKEIVARGRPSSLLADVMSRGGPAAGLGFPSGHAAVAAALVTVAAPWLPRTVRRAAWVLVGVVAVARVFVGAHLPVDVIGGEALGWAVGAGVHLLRGAPGGRPAGAAVRAALQAAGMPVAALRPLRADARASTPFLAALEDGRQLFVKVVGREQRDADLLFKAYRFVVYRSVEDEAPFATAKHQVEHEAFLSLLAERAGARVPRLVTVAAMDDGSCALVHDHLDGQGMDRIGAAQLDDGLLGDVWAEVTKLHEARIAHRDLRLANIMVNAQGEPVVVDFGFAESGASQRQLAHDVAELLAATAAVVGADRAVAAAEKAVDTARLATAGGLLQPMALSTETRAAARRVLADVRSRLADSSGIRLDAMPPVTRVRVRPKTIIGLAAAAFGIHLLLPQVGQLGHTLSAVRSARPAWLLLALAGSAVTYVMAAVALRGAVAAPLPFVRTVAVQVAASFVSRLAPSGLGAAGLNERYLERQGIARASAIAAVGLSAAAGFVVHVAALGVAVVAFGRSSVRGFRLPTDWPLLVAAVVGAVALIALFGPSRWRRKLVAATRQALGDLGRALRRPRGTAALFGGSVGITAAYLMTLVASLQAFGAHAPVAHVAVVYLVGVAVASAVPTPGGLGVTEAALVAGLTSLGVASGAAVAAVLMFRLLTFWLPILPAAVVFRHLRQRAAV